MIDLEKIYYIPRSDLVLNYLQSHPYLLDILIEAEYRIRSFFPHAELVLSRYQDIELDHIEGLLISISTTLEVDQAFVQLKRLDNDWWLNKYSEFGHKLMISLDFKDEAKNDSVF